MNNKILVVGGAGYVGSVLCRELLEKGYAVRVADRLYFGDHGLRGIRDRVELLDADMRAIPKQALSDVHAVINLGGLSNDPMAEYNPEANHQLNTVAAYQLAELAKVAGVGRYILASSASIFDRGVFNEELDVVQDERSEVAPKAAYSCSKLEAERLIAPLTDEQFAPTFLRKGTIFGYSPRLRYDLVVNTFVKDAMRSGRIRLVYGGEMWRPLLDIRDAARAYIAVLEADVTRVTNQVFAVSSGNFRIAELALRVRDALRDQGVDPEIVADYGYASVRSYRISSRKLRETVGWSPAVTIEESVRDLVTHIRQENAVDFDNPRYYNIAWMKLLEESEKIVRSGTSLFAGAGDERRPAWPVPAS